MSERTYSAGLVTAYGAAVRGGYRGTYAEFCRQQAEYADNAAAVEQAKTEVQSAATSAAGSATSAGASATAAAGSATSAGASATASAGSATTAGQHKDAAATSATNAASSATAAEAAATSAATSARAAQAVLESIPEDYSDLSKDVDDLKADLGDVKNGLSDVISAKFTNVDIVANPSFASSIMADGYHSANGTWTSGETYTSYVLNKGNTYQIAFGALASTAYYVQMCIFTGSVEKANFVARYRSLSSNLPTIDNPMTITENQVVVIATTDATLSVPITTNWNQSLELNTDAMEQVQARIDSSLNIKNLKIIYDDTATDTETERLYIYVPTTSGYIRYNFAHNVNASRNSNCWVIHPLYAVTDALTERYAVTTSGEFECALRIDGSPDFMGGSAHGSEIVTDIHVLIDGTEITPSSIVSLTECDEIRVIERSNLYDPNDEVTLTAIHGKEYIWTKDKLIINQSVVWQAVESLKTSYLAMFPIAKTAVDNITPNDTFETLALPGNGYIRRAGIDAITTWSDTLGLIATFSIPRWDINGSSLVNVGEFQVTDNNGGAYHKMYYECLTSGNVGVGDAWKTTTEYTIQIGV